MCKKLIFLISFVIVLLSVSGLAQAANETWFEAEDANPMTSPLMTYDDDPCSSGGEYIGVALGNNSTDSSPAPDGTATYIFDVPETGTYKVFVRAKEATESYDDDSAYVQIQGATYSSGSDWIKWNNINDFIGTDWEWLPVHNNDDGDAVVEFTMDAGQYALELAYREDGLYFDAILITDDLDLDPSTLPDAIPSGSSCVEENILVNGSFEDGLDPWVFDNASPTYEVIEGGAQHGGKALKVTIDAPGSSEYIPALAQPGLVFETGKHYTFSVFLKGSYDGMQVFLKPQDRGGDWTGYGAEYVTLTTEWAEYSVTTPDFGTILEDDHDISIWLGMQAGDVYIDHARWYEGDYVAPCPPEGPPPAVVKATKPDPANGTSDLTRFNTLSWTPGDYADSHNVYLGTDMQAVQDATVDNPMDVLVSQQQLDALIETAGDYGTTYYWRVDEVNEADMTIYPGNVWSFSTKPIGLIVPQSSITATASGQKDADQGPEKTIDGSGITGDLHDSTSTNMWLSDTPVEPNLAWIRYDFDQSYKMPRMLIWNHNLASAVLSGYAIQEVIVEYSNDGGATWTALDITTLPKGTGSDLEPVIVDLGGVADGLAINAVRITALSNYSPMFSNCGLSEVRFYYVPVRPTDPSPADGTTGIGVTPELTWTAGDGVVEHKVYFGQDEQAVTDGTADSFMTADPSFSPSGLILDETYFWRVEEVNMASDPNAWSGDTWSFTTSPFRVVDDFESYNNSVSNWSGGSSSSGNGAAIALDTDVANSGSNSMIFMYDDSSNRGFSEISVDPGKLASGRNWTTGGAKWLVFYVYGNIPNDTSEKLYVTLNSAKYWNQQELIDDSELVSPWWTQVIVPLIPGEVNLGNVDTLKIAFHRTGSTLGTGSIKIDDIRLYKDLPEVLEPVNPGDANLVARYKMENNVKDSTSNGIDGTILGDPTFVNHDYPGFGKALVFDANEDLVDLGPADPFNFTGSFSISLWANIADWSGEWGNAMVATRGEGSEGFQVRRGGGWIAGMQGKTADGLSFTTRGISLDGMSNSEDMIVDPPAIGRWTNIVCVFDAEAGAKKVYFDGKLIQESATEADAVLGAASQNASLGARANSGNTGFEALMNGSLDEVRLYDRALTDAEAKFLSDPTP